MFIVKMADHDGNHRCLVEKNVPIALILPSRWRDGAESLGIECTSCLCNRTDANLLFNLARFFNFVILLGIISAVVDGKYRVGGNVPGSKETVPDVRDQLRWPDREVFLVQRIGCLESSNGCCSLSRDYRQLLVLS